MVFDLYKANQGKNTRLFSGFGLAIIVALGCWQLYQQLQAWNLNPWIVTLVPVGLFAGLAILIFILSNQHKVADFMISAEGEIKKVSWSTRQEIYASTLIVIIVVICMAVLLGVTDLCFEYIFKWFFRMKS
jgi:preprotein translocase subunit SecE